MSRMLWFQRVGSRASRGLSSVALKNPGLIVNDQGA